MNYPKVVFTPHVSGTGGDRWGSPVVKKISGTNPAAGAEITEAVPSNKLWLPLSIYFSLVTDATVANRRVRLQVDDGTTVFAEVTTTNPQTASLTWRYEWAYLGQDLENTATLILAHSFPALFLPEAYRIKTSTATIQAGDDYGAPTLIVVEYTNQ